MYVPCCLEIKLNHGFHLSYLSSSFLTENTCIELVGKMELQDGDIMQLNCSYNKTEPPPLYNLYFFGEERHDINTVSFQNLSCVRKYQK